MAITDDPWPLGDPNRGMELGHGWRYNPRTGRIHPAGVGFGEWQARLAAGDPTMPAMPEAFRARTRIPGMAGMPDLIWNPNTMRLRPEAMNWVRWREQGGGGLPAIPGRLRGTRTVADQEFRRRLRDLFGLGDLRRWWEITTDESLPGPTEPG
jgi:hypothetical protein